MPYLNISFWLLIGTIIGWFAHSLHLSSTQGENREMAVAEKVSTSHLQASKDIISKDSFEYRLNEHISKGDMRAAMDTYSDVSRQDPQKKEKFGIHILEQVERMLGQGKNESAQKLLAEYLKTNAYNPNALLLQAKIHHFGKNYMQALTNALEAKIYSKDQGMIDRSDALIEEITAHYEKSLRATKQWAQIEQLFLFLIERDPDINIAGRYYKLGYAQYRQGLLQQAIDTLETVKYDENIGDKASSLYDLATQLNEADGNIIAIPIESNAAGHWIVNAVINGKTVPLIIDTGASLTVLDKDSAIALKLYQPEEKTDALEKTTVKTASSISDILILSENTLEIGEISLKNTTLGIMDMPLSDNDAYDGLLGMDFLSFFEFQIDQTNAVLKLQP